MAPSQDRQHHHALSVGHPYSPICSELPSSMAWIATHTPPQIGISDAERASQYFACRPAQCGLGETLLAHQSRLVHLRNQKGLHVSRHRLGQQRATRDTPSLDGGLRLLLLFSPRRRSSSAIRASCASNPSFESWSRAARSTGSLESVPRSHVNQDLRLAPTPHAAIRARDRIHPPARNGLVHDLGGYEKPSWIRRFLAVRSRRTGQ